MKQGLKVVDLTQELRRIATIKRDFVADVPQISVVERAVDGDATVVRLDVAGIGELGITDVAHDQLAAYLGIPSKFYDHLLLNHDSIRTVVDYSPSRRQLVPAGFGYASEWGGDVRVSDIIGTHSLYDTTVNTLLRHMGSSDKPDKRLIRELDGKCRAFLSSSFNLEIDNFDVAMVAFAAMDQLGLSPDNVVSSDVTDKYLHIKVTSPKLQAYVVGDLVQFGFYIRTSEVGLAGLDISSYNVNLTCTNGAVMESLFKRRHIGKQLEWDNDGVVYMSDTRQAEAKARLLQMRDTIKTAMDEHRIAALADKMNEKASLKINLDLPKVMEVTKKRFGLRDGEDDEVLGHFLEGKDLSLWGLSNAITRTAQDRRSYDRASELEATGYALLMSGKEQLDGIVRS